MMRCSGNDEQLNAEVCLFLGFYQSSAGIDAKVSLKVKEDATRAKAARFSFNPA